MTGKESQTFTKPMFLTGVSLELADQTRAKIQVTTGQSNAGPQSFLWLVRYSALFTSAIWVAKPMPSSVCRSLPSAHYFIPARFIVFYIYCQVQQLDHSHRNLHKGYEIGHCFLMG